jgi:hypothetical protein
MRRPLRDQEDHEMRIRQSGRDRSLQVVSKNPWKRQRQTVTAAAQPSPPVLPSSSVQPDDEQPPAEGAETSAPARKRLSTSKVDAASSVERARIGKGAPASAAASDKEHRRETAGSRAVQSSRQPTQSATAWVPSAVDAANAEILRSLGPSRFFSRSRPLSTSVPAAAEPSQPGVSDRRDGRVWTSAAAAADASQVLQGVPSARPPGTAPAAQKQDRAYSHREAVGSLGKPQAAARHSTPLRATGDAATEGTRQVVMADMPAHAQPEAHDSVVDVSPSAARLQHSSVQAAEAEAEAGKHGSEADVMGAAGKPLTDQGMPVSQVMMIFSCSWVSSLFSCGAAC